MISNDTIKNLANKYQTSELNVIREYCQHLFLSYFYQKKLSEKVLFKGGTALRIIYNSPRFSEDLDFSVFGMKNKQFEELFLSTIVDIEKTGINIELEEGKFTLGGYLGIINFNIWNTSNIIRIEASFREKTKINGEVILVKSDYLPPYTIVILPEPKLIEEKIKALICRKKPRDFFDIYFLLRTELSIEKNKLNLLPILEILEKSKLDFKKELSILLPRSYHSILKNFKDTLRKEIKKYGY